jgi:mannose-1-phosphate guanylyltransferase
MLCALIMSGGAGQRFWPMSTEDRPKQLLKLFSDKSMIRETVDRIIPLIPIERIFIATNVKQKEGVLRELPMLSEENIILEPSFKDTAAAIGYGTMYIQERYQEAEIVVLASDHLIKDPQGFREVIARGAQEALENKTIVTLGIYPTKPETGYGYIETHLNPELNSINEVIKFWEKPDLERAQVFLQAGNYLWNSGMFIFSLATLQEEMKVHMQEHVAILESIKPMLQGQQWGESLTQQVAPYFEKFEKISIDYGVMEKSNRIRVIPSSFGWNDIGSFTAIEEVFEPNAFGSWVRDAKHKSYESEGNIIIAEGDTVATLGVKDLVIVKSGNNILVCHKDYVQDIKKVL